MEKTLRIGRHRGNARIWIEGAALLNTGWHHARPYEVTHSHRRIELRPCGDGGRRVAGNAKRPIIDLNSATATEAFDGCTHVHIRITEEAITITPGTAPASKIAAAVAATAAFFIAAAAPWISQFPPHAKRVLLACEESATVRDEFIRLGHDAVSCDLMPTRNPYGWHIRGDVLPVLRGEWDLVIGFPPCTYLTASAAWAFNDPDFGKYPGVGYHQRLQPGTLTGAARREAREEAIALVKAIWESATQVAIENPAGFLSSMWRRPDQVIEPWHHGDPHSKATCLWLRNLPPLEPTDKLDITLHGWKAPNGKWRWMNQTPNGQNNIPPSADRAKIRSKTYPGIARAMAAQWGKA